MSIPNPPTDWQMHCTKQLKDAVNVGEFSGRTQWQSFRASLPIDAKRITIADADFSEKSLSGFDLSRCWIGRTNFNGANLSHTNFHQTIFRECSADNANIEGANFRLADLRGDGLSLLTSKFDNNTIFEILDNALPYSLNEGLRIAAARAHSARRWRQAKSRSPFIRSLFWLTQYGFSVNRLSILVIIVVFVFSLLFSIMGYKFSLSLLSSIKYFLSLNDTFEDNILASTLGSIESLIGMLFFAVLTSVLVTAYFEKH